MSTIDYAMEEEENRPRELVCDRVSGELMLETVRACRALADLAEQIDVEITSGETGEKFLRRMTRLTFLFRLIPSVLDPRRVICLADMAAARPDWWKANRLHFFCPELSHKQIAEILGLAPHQVRDAIKAVEIAADCYDNLPPMERY